jgi:hypothetical protein
LLHFLWCSFFTFSKSGINEPIFSPYNCVSVFHSILRHSGTSLSNLGCCGESKLNTIPSVADISTGNTMPETQTLVAVPAISMEALAVIPFHRKSHPEFAQRRIRRPFSVSEVEALVQAVEKLGTGRFV